MKLQTADDLPANLASEDMFSNNYNATLSGARDFRRQLRGEQELVALSFCRDARIATSLQMRIALRLVAYQCR